jgi:hypothetical protein
MKKFSMLAALVIVLFAACNKNKSTEQQAIVPEKETINTAAVRECAAYDVLEEKLRKDPSIQQRIDAIEEFTTRYVQNPSAFRLVGSDLEVPVVVNVLYSSPSQDVSDAQIASQIAVLNADFGGTNADLFKTATYDNVKFKSTSTLPKIKFVLAGTVRKLTTISSWGTNDAMKRSSTGGIDATSPTTTLNMWVCNMGGGILGYAQFPNTGTSETDGVVCDNNAFGTTGTATAPFNKGRTATHEVGHYFNLRHIWGDKRCGTDGVGDTPAHTGANYGCPAEGIRSSCSGRPVMMTMNYMDYTDDACMYMFSIGQVSRMNATWATGGPRAGLR